MSIRPTAGLLARQLKQMQTDKDIPGISCGLVDHNIFEWEVMLMINDECKYYGGMIRCQVAQTEWTLIFPRRWILPSTINLSVRVSASSPKDEVRDAYISPQ